ncbi:Putative L-lactate dehydrogenase operon regulatory protein [Roseobacter fucihabitans]|uniref:L-lactate dehydrogenase operon regulatory protein n=1 Tax=Roseobacter fucihabitans TaxID=1537242 RepID=A0ABZ2BQF3_9RHOB|nr:FCD domain-containing protein [Roseobacter litoralis]MBC6964177.1 putative L-lactate dehydrogenase operon regulatory protein [Roseobacter litoralis]
MDKKSPEPGFRLYRKVADQIAGIIAQEALLPGTRLPSERVLSDRLKVARSTVREAMIALEIAGQVSIRTGSGIYVDQPGVTTDTDLGAGPLELLDARELIECEIAARAAASIDATQLMAMEISIEAMAAAHGRGTHREADHAFHIALAKATRIEPLVGIIDRLWSQMFSPMFERMGALTGLFGEPQDTALEHHRLILDALVARDADLSRQRMKAHLVEVRRVLLRASAFGAGSSDKG